MREIRLITFSCSYCGSLVKGYMNTNGSITFSVINKLHSSKDCLSESGYYICVECKSINNIKFEFVYK